MLLEVQKQYREGQPKSLKDYSCENNALCVQCLVVKVQDWSKNKTQVDC